MNFLMIGLSLGRISFVEIVVIKLLRTCVRRLHLQSQMTKSPRMHAVNIRLKQTGIDNFPGKQCCRLWREVVLSPRLLRPLLTS